ncbi:TonB-linked outer membrane protein, SusC/RagA family [Chryseolinea serpens]|uniref:TonB-linked outer membrane protein, SusC/RagA family n=2 Tax=Chryseolinea serpens TaxID=947013 RepID=A0A1M5P0H7_9BACT|nr:TonB-linked outer membrane protein, SusC/RagA family [Chryseolinea serpens]
MNLNWSRMKALIKACVLHTLPLFCCITLLSHHSAKAQGVLERQVSFNLQHITLKKALETLEVATRVKFVYSVNQIDVTKVVSTETDGKTLAEILDQLLLPLNIEYKIQDDNEYIVLSRSAGRSGDETSPENIIPLITISGRVTDTKGIGLAGVNVVVKNTTTGTSTDIRGNFNLQSVPANSILVVSFIGYATYEAEVDGQTSMVIVLEEELTSLAEVVITAMGIPRPEKSLTYGTQQIDAEELTHAKTDNMMNTLNGKVPGMTVFPSASGLGGSAKVILRGNRSFSQSNQPLYVLDGLPMLNSSNSNGQPNTPFGGQVDGGDGISNLNPDDVESITVLKGASAAALYGSQAANGAIIITTKKAREGITELNYNSNVYVSDIAYRPQFQTGYGRTGSNARDSWGAPMASPADDKLKTFFHEGVNFINSVNLASGSEKNKIYCSFANTNAQGPVPHNTLARNNFSLQQSQKLFDRRLVVDAGLHYITQKVENTPALGLYFNPLTGLYLFPSEMNISPYKAQYEFADRVGYERQNWFTNEDIQQNPWWIINRNPNYSHRRRLLLSGRVAFDVNRWINIQVRGNLDQITDRYQQNLFSGTQATLARPNGQFIDNTQTQEQKYADALLAFKIPMPTSFGINGTVGTSITDSRLDGTAVGPGLGLIMPDVFKAQNIVASSMVNPVYNYPDNHTQLQSIFGTVNAAYSDWLHLNLTGRNDWSSNLSFTPNLSYFYPSMGVSVLLKDALDLPTRISYFKVRANYAEVGNTVPQYVTNPVNSFDNTGSVTLSTAAPFETLKPERTKTYELGTDLRLFENRLALTFNYYRSNTFNQFIKVVPSVATAYSAGYVNGGNVQNTGIELSMEYILRMGWGFRWETSINVAHNVNRIIDVDSKNGIDKYLLTTNDNTSYQSVLAKGGSYGDIYGITVMRDAAQRMVLNDDGTPRINTNFSYLGNPNPHWITGWNNSITYRNFTLNFLIDAKIGGKVFSMTQAIMDQYGISKATGDARDKGYVPVNGVNEKGEAISKVDPQKWYTSIGGRQGVSELYIYSATVARVREVSLGYSIPLRKYGISKLRVSLTGRNLLYLYREAPYDPELLMSTGNGLSGIDIFNQPAIRNIGFALNVTI